MFAAVADERRSIATLIDGLDAGELATASLCTGWDVKTVAAHLVSDFGDAFWGSPYIKPTRLLPTWHVYSISSPGIDPPGPVTNASRAHWPAPRSVNRIEPSSSLCPRGGHVVEENHLQRNPFPCVGATVHDSRRQHQRNVADLALRP